MKVRPIIMSAESVRAILDGRKIMTRRIVKNQERLRESQNDYGSLTAKAEYLNIYGSWQEWVPNAKSLQCPYGVVGDILWVRENTYVYGLWFKNMDTGKRVFCRARAMKVFFEDTLPDDVQVMKCRHPNSGYYKNSSIYMPKKDCRIILEITDIRVERLQDITEEDAFMEGCEVVSVDHPMAGKHLYGFGVDDVDGKGFSINSAKEAYQNLWNDLNAKRGYPWESNPWVWVISFKKVSE